MATSEVLERPEHVRQTERGEPVTFLEAIREAIWEEMERDPRVFLMGEDIGPFGGAFKVTEGMADFFGASRVIDTPIAETGFTGAAAGAAHMGMRPVVEMQFIDFIATAYDMITNYIATSRYRGTGPQPLVIRGPSGGGTRGGPFHSQNPEAAFFHTPGLKIAYPATAYDAKGLMKAAIRDDDPVLFFEQKALYRRPQLREVLPNEDYMVPLGKARVHREGSDLTIVTYAAMVHKSLEAAARLEEEDGLSVEVLDLRTLLPLDEEAIVKSVKKTNRVVVAYEDSMSWGYGAEIAARIADDCFAWLDAPVRRLASTDTFVGYAPRLEDAILPQTEDFARVYGEVAGY